jgi:hypothetical protein
MLIHLSFHICDIKEFDLLIGYPLEKLLKEGHTGKLDICCQMVRSRQPTGVLILVV